MVPLLLPPLTVDSADVYPQMSTGLLVLGHHNISTVHYRKVWKKMFPFLEEIEKKKHFRVFKNSRKTLLVLPVHHILSLL